MHRQFWTNLEKMRVWKSFSRKSYLNTIYTCKGLEMFQPQITCTTVDPVSMHRTPLLKSVVSGILAKKFEYDTLNILIFLFGFTLFLCVTSIFMQIVWHLLSWNLIIEPYVKIKWWERTRYSFLKWRMSSS